MPGWVGVKAIWMVQLAEGAQTLPGVGQVPDVA